MISIDLLIGKFICKITNTKQIVMFPLASWHVTLGTKLEFGKASLGPRLFI